jgi:hypothetical protein
MEQLGNNNEQESNKSLNSIDNQPLANNQNENIKNLANSLHTKNNHFIKMMCIIIGIITCLVIVFVIADIYYYIPNEKYKEAVGYYNKKEYDKAITAFSNLNGYKNSNDMIKTVKQSMYDNLYKEAIGYYDKKEYDKAITAFSNLNGYKNSNDMINVVKQSMYDDLISTLKNEAINKNWDAMANMILERDKNTPDNEIFEQLSSTLQEIEDNKNTLDKANSKLQTALNNYNNKKNELVTMNINITDAENIRENALEVYNEAKEKYDNTTKTSSNIELYIVGFIGKDDKGIQEYEVAKAIYYSWSDSKYGYSDKVPSDKHALLFTGYTQYSSKGWTNLEVVNIGTTSVQLNNGFTEEWTSYMEKSYYDDTFGKINSTELQDAKDTYDEAVNSYNNLKASKDSLDAEVENLRIKYENEQSEYNKVKDQYNTIEINLYNQIYNLLGLDLISESEENIVTVEDTGIDSNELLNNSVPDAEKAATDKTSSEKVDTEKAAAEKASEEKPSLQDLWDTVSIDNLQGTWVGPVYFGSKDILIISGNYAVLKSVKADESEVYDTYEGVINITDRSKSGKCPMLEIGQNQFVMYIRYVKSTYLNSYGDKYYKR